MNPLRFLQALISLTMPAASGPSRPAVELEGVLVCFIRENTLLSSMLLQLLTFKKLVPMLGTTYSDSKMP
jgi:hypothetical protein